MQKVNLTTAQHYTWGDGWPLADSAGLSVKQERMPAGTTEIPHHHDLAQQVFYVLTGQLTLKGRDAALTLGPGDAANIPPGEVHQARNDGADDVHFLVISSPTTAGDRVAAADWPA